MVARADDTLDIFENIAGTLQAPNTLALPATPLTVTACDPDGLAALNLDPLLGTSGCTLDVSLDATLVGITSAAAPADLSFTFGIPATAAGLQVHVQHAVFEAVPGGLSWSNGLTIQVP